MFKFEFVILGLLISVFVVRFLLVSLFVFLFLFDWFWFLRVAVIVWFMLLLVVVLIRGRFFNFNPKRFSWSKRRIKESVSDQN